MLIAVSMYDKHYEPAVDNELELGEPDPKEVIHNMLSQIHPDSQNHSVIPLCGLWALLAEDLRNSPDDPKVHRKIRRACPRFSEENISELQSEQIADQLKAWSNISELRSRFEQQLPTHLGYTLHSLTLE